MSRWVVTGLAAMIVFRPACNFASNKSRPMYSYDQPYVFVVGENTTLSAENQLEDGNPVRQRDVSDFINNPPGLRINRAKEGSLKEQLFNIP